MPIQFDRTSAAKRRRVCVCVSPLYLRVPMFPSRGLEPGGGPPANEDAPHLGENVPAFFQFNF